MSDILYGYELISIGHLVKRENDRFMDEVKKNILDTDDVYCGDLSILDFLSKNNNDEVYQKDIEQYLSLTAPSVSTKLRKLQGAGLIERVYSKKDTRLKKVILTQKGVEIDVQMSEEVRNFDERITRLLSESEKEVLKDVFRKLKREFE